MIQYRYGVAVSGARLKLRRQRERGTEQPERPTALLQLTTTTATKGCNVIQLRLVKGCGPDYYEVLTDDGYYMGDVELEPDGSWTADITHGNWPPKLGFATRDEAVAYVVNPWPEQPSTSSTEVR